MPTEKHGVRELRRPVRSEAAAWGIVSAINNAFIQPLLISRGAGPILLGIYNSGANLFGFGSGFAGPRLAARVGSVQKAALICLALARLVFFAMPVFLIATADGSVNLLVVLVLLWSAGEGLALPLWTSFLAGLVGPAERGRWLALRATAATSASACVMIALVVLLRFQSKETVLPIAYAIAAAAGIVSLLQLRRIFALAEPPPVPAARSVRSLPEGAAARRFLLGVTCFWFGAGLMWPILPRYIIHSLHAPTAYFGIAAVVAALSGLVTQRRWGRLADERGARQVLLLGGLGAGAVPILWALVPVYWLGYVAEMVAASCWPGHLLGLTMRSVELAAHEGDRPSLLAWTSLAQGTGAFLSPLVASVAVDRVGTIPLLVLSGLLRVGATLILAQPSRTLVAPVQEIRVSRRPRPRRRAMGRARRGRRLARQRMLRPARDVGRRAGGRRARRRSAGGRQ